WIFVFYVNVFPYLSWSFVPILALHGILFGRIAGSVEPRFRYLADVGALVLFTVAAATIVVILQSPGTTGFVQAECVSLAISPAAPWARSRGSSRPGLRSRTRRRRGSPPAQ